MEYIFQLEIREEFLRYKTCKPKKERSINLAIKIKNCLSKNTAKKGKGQLLSNNYDELGREISHNYPRALSSGQYGSIHLYSSHRDIHLVIMPLYSYHLFKNIVIGVAINGAHLDFKKLLF